MYNEKIEKLIDLALVDGVLSEKEKQVLFKNAEEAGIDLDEFEMVLESKLYTQNKTSVTETSVAPKSDKLGDIRKCPACGAIIPSFTTVCPDCGYELRNVGVSNSISEFTKKLDEIENLNSNKGEFYIDYGKSGRNSSITVGIILKWVLFYWILIPIRIFNMLINKNLNLSSVDQRKKEFIANYPIPAAKEDLIEFMTLATSRVAPISMISYLNEDSKVSTHWNDVWIAKIKQIEKKASISMKSDKTAMSDLTDLSAMAYSQIEANKKSMIIIYSVAIILAIAMTSTILFM